MEYTALISALAGALIGSATSVITMIVQNVFQNRQAKKLIVDMAFKDNVMRIEQAGDGGKKPGVAALPVILAYHEKMLRQIEARNLKPSTVKETLRRQQELSLGVMEVYEE